MSTYEIALLIGSLFGAMAFLALASVVLDRGSVRIFMTFFAIAAGSLYIAHENGEEGLNIRDLPPALGKVVSMVRGEA